MLRKWNDWIRDLKKDDIFIIQNQCFTQTNLVHQLCAIMHIISSYRQEKFNGLFCKFGIRNRIYFCNMWLLAVYCSYVKASSNWTLISIIVFKEQFEKLCTNNNFRFPRKSWNELAVFLGRFSWHGLHIWCGTGNTIYGHTGNAWWEQRWWSGCYSRVPSCTRGIKRSAYGRLSVRREL